jgi:hypothetical protein
LLSSGFTLWFKSRLLFLKPWRRWFMLHWMVNRCVLAQIFLTLLSYRQIIFSSNSIS